MSKVNIQVEDNKTSVHITSLPKIDVLATCSFPNPDSSFCFSKVDSEMTSNFKNAVNSIQKAFANIHELTIATIYKNNDDYYDASYIGKEIKEGVECVTKYWRLKINLNYEKDVDIVI